MDISKLPHALYPSFKTHIRFTVWWAFMTIVELRSKIVSQPAPWLNFFHMWMSVERALRSIGTTTHVNPNLDISKSRFLLLLLLLLHFVKEDLSISLIEQYTHRLKKYMNAVSLVFCFYFQRSCFWTEYRQWHQRPRVFKPLMTFLHKTITFTFQLQ